MAITEKTKCETNGSHGTAAAAATANASVSKKKSAFMTAVAVLRFRSALAAALARRQRRPLVFGTFYGRRRGHVQLAFQSDPRTQPLALMELPTATNELVREMAASGLMRIALECDRAAAGGDGVRLLEEPLWRVYCNGLRSGFAVRRECGVEDWKVLCAVGPVSVGAGVLPAASAGDGDDREVMYMRARFERVVGSRDSEAYYMLNPDGNGGPDQLSVYLLRV